MTGLPGHRLQSAHSPVLLCVDKYQQIKFIVRNSQEEWFLWAIHSTPSRKPPGDQRTKSRQRVRHWVPRLHAAWRRMASMLAARDIRPAVPRALESSTLGQPSGAAHLCVNIETFPVRSNLNTPSRTTMTSKFSDDRPRTGAKFSHGFTTTRQIST